MSYINFFHLETLYVTWMSFVGGSSPLKDMTLALAYIAGPVRSDRRPVKWRK